MPSSQAIDLQIAGVRDDGSAHGIVDANIKSGPLVLVPWREGHYNASFNFVTGAVGGADNGDGSNTYLQSQPAAGLPSAAYYIKHMFYGTSYGIRFDPIFTSGGGGKFDFCVFIDRVAYRVTKQRFYPDTLADWDVQGNAMHGVIVTRDLPDGPHIAEINVVPNVTTNGQRFFGFLADAKYYRQYPARAYPNTPAALTTAFATISLATVTRFRGIGLRSILYANGDTAPRIVTVQFQGTPIWTKTIAARDSALFDPATILGIDSTAGDYKHKVDAVTSITATTLTRSGTTATFTASTNHNLVTGDIVTISGSNLGPYNVTNAIVTVTSATVFTYTMASDPGGSSAGTPVFTTAVQATVIGAQ